MSLCWKQTLNLTSQSWFFSKHHLLMKIVWHPKGLKSTRSTLFGLLSAWVPICSDNSVQKRQYFDLNRGTDLKNLFCHAISKNLEQVNNFLSFHEQGEKIQQFLQQIGLQRIVNLIFEADFNYQFLLKSCQHLGLWNRVRHGLAQYTILWWPKLNSLGFGLYIAKSLTNYSAPDTVCPGKS